MAMLQGLPVTASLYSAAGAVLDKQHQVAQLQADLNKMVASNTATEDELVQKRNELERAKREEFEAELRLDEAKVSASQKNTKTLQGLHDGVSDLSAGLDQDLGFSKGLPGLADNLVRFLGALATAPLKALLDPIAKQGDGSSGLFGLAFGGTAKEQQQGGYAPNYPGAPGVSGMPGVPGESARDFAHRAMMPYWQSQGFTVGDHAADQYGEHQNGALDIMVPNIDAGNRVLQQMVNDPNVYGAIFNNKTYGYGHGATPQDYTAGHTGNPTQDHQDHVHGWYKPGGPNNIVPGMAGGPLNTGMPRGLPTGAPLGTVGPAGSPMAGYQSPAPYSAQGMPQAQQGWQPQGGGGIGFGGGVKVTLRGQPVDLTPFNRNNVARLELK